MKSESDFRRWFVSQLRSDCDIVPIESTSSRGVPDLNLCRQGVEIWVELKLFVGGRVLLRPEQYSWGIRRAGHGGNSFVLAWHPSGLHVWKFPNVIIQSYGKYVMFTSVPTLLKDDQIKSFLFT